MSQMMHLRRTWRYIAEVVATSLFWGAWLYVVMPLVSLILWFAGIYVFVEQMVFLGGYEAFIEKLVEYGLVVFGIFVAITFWVGWNARRYGAHNTRLHFLAPVTLQETAGAAGLTAAVVQDLQARKRIEIDFNDFDHMLVKQEDSRSVA